MEMRAGEIVKAQLDYFNTNITKNLDFRARQLRKLKYALKESEKLLTESIYVDFGKSEFDTYTNELALIYGDIRQALKNLRRWARRRKTGTNSVNMPGRSYIIPEPLGVSLIIGAWNYPYQLSLCPVVAAIAAGCTVVLKPSELSAAASRAMAKIVAENFDPRYFTVVEGGITETTELLEQKFDKIFFTGSVSVGRIVYKAAAENLTPVTLELGGKSPAFVTAGCKMDICVKRLVWAKFLNAGQTCIAPDYVLVHRSVKERFLAQLANEIGKGDYSAGGGNYVRVINRKHMEWLAGMLDRDKIYMGGNYDMEQGYFEPTVMTGVAFDDRVMREKIFGPILPVIEYNILDEAIAQVKSRPKPLSCYVFTADKKVKDKILHEISFGGGAVNDAVMHVANNRLPFGGVGSSGIGAYHGEAGFRAFSHYKSILEKSTLLEPGLKYPPHTPKKLSLIRKIMG